MYKLSLVALLVIAASLMFGSNNRQEPATTTAADLPAGPMQEKARTACTVCHDAQIITQQRLSKDAWTKEVDKMVRWGTQLDAGDREPLIEYLSTSFSPEKPPARQIRPGKGK
ncbi:MAG TPA: hypothetical protein VKW06_03280 [Candidatus Angelobacter sp.]|nr:hypothetical protein [Candidatus Angelobacter sp.]